jgi:hypothetical protein
MMHPAVLILASAIFAAPVIDLDGDAKVSELLKEQVVYADGSSYAGQLLEGKKQGFGIYLWPDGAEYRGRFRDGEPDGEGLYLYADGRRKRVTYDRGTMVHAFMVSNTERVDGAEYGEYDFNGHYCGWFRGDKLRGYVPHGRGIMRYLNGSVYTGQWENGKMHGNGTIRWEDGSVYAGQWVHGKRTGYGSYMWASGDRYVGQWKENQLYGPGTFYHNNGFVEKGFWGEKVLVIKE